MGGFFEGWDWLHVVFGSLKMVLGLRLVRNILLLFLGGLAGISFGVVSLDEYLIDVEIFDVQHLPLLFHPIQNKPKIRSLRMFYLNRSLALLTALEVALLVLDDALHLFEPFLNLPVLGYCFEYIGNAVRVMQGRGVPGLVGVVVGVLAAFLNLQLVVLQELSIIFEDIRVLVLPFGLMLTIGFALFTFLSLVFIDLVAVSIILQYSDLLVLSLLRPREVLVVHEFALAIDRTVFERLAFLAMLAASLL